MQDELRIETAAYKLLKKRKPPKGVSIKQGYLFTIIIYDVCNAEHADWIYKIMGALSR